jgi:hypothetical protein
MSRLLRLQRIALLLPLLAACQELPDSPTVPSESCLFGAQFSDIRDNPALNIEAETWLRSVAALGSELAHAQLVLAVQQSSHTDVTTAEQALARLDQQEVRRIELSEPAHARRYTVYEYGVGDNSYGAFFVAGTTTLVAAIHDGDLLDCGVYTALP